MAVGRRVIQGGHREPRDLLRVASTAQPITAAVALDDQLTFRNCRAAEPGLGFAEESVAHEVGHRTFATVGRATNGGEGISVGVELHAGPASRTVNCDRRNSHTLHPC